jgi:hypothetical protein
MTEAAPHLTTALPDRYRIERELGQGGMDAVFHCESLSRAQRGKAAQHPTWQSQPFLMADG